MIALPDTVKELEDYARSILPGVRITGFSYIRDEGQARRRLTTLERLLCKYPDQRDKIKALVYSVSMGENDISQWDRTRLILSATTSYTRAEFRSAVMSGRYHTSFDTDPDAYLIAHEFGHILAERTTAVREFRRCVEVSSGLIGMRALAHAVATGQISRYGKKWSEAIAEGFATMEISPNVASDLEQLAHRILVREEDLR